MESITVNVQATKSPITWQLKFVCYNWYTEKMQIPEKSYEFLCPDLIDHWDTLSFDKETTKLALFRKIQHHKSNLRTHEEGERPKISSTNLISGMKVTKVCHSKN